MAEKKVALYLSCEDCDGTGRFYDQGRCVYIACRTCNGTGDYGIMISISELKRLLREESVTFGKEIDYDNT